MRTHLYRHFGPNDELLYVGVSLSAINRLAQHREHSKWFASIRRVSIEEFPTRDEALAAETKAIQTESPIWNVHKKKQPPPPVKPLTQAERSEHALVERVVAFDVCYSVREAAAHLRIPYSIIKEFARTGKIASILLSSSSRKNNYGGQSIHENRIITGWQLLEFVESISKTGQLNAA